MSTSENIMYGATILDIVELLHKLSNYSYLWIQNQAKSTRNKFGDYTKYIYMHLPTEACIVKILGYFYAYSIPAL